MPCTEGTCQTDHYYSTDRRLLPDCCQSNNTDKLHIQPGVTAKRNRRLQHDALT